MNKFVKNASAVAGLVALGLSAQATAGEGFYVGGQIGSSTSSHSIERNTGDVNNPSLTTLAEETDVSFGVHAGYKVKVTEDAFVAAEVFYNDESAETINLNNMLKTRIDLESSYGINFKAGVEVTPKFSVYGIAGATWVDFDIHNGYPFAPPTRSGSDDDVALSLGAGFEYAVSSQLSVKAEYTRVNDLDFNGLPEFPTSQNNRVNPNEIDYDNISVSLSYYF